MIVVAAGHRRRVRLVNGCLAASACLVVSACWLAVNDNGRLVWEYLTAFGYGAASDDDGQAHLVILALGAALGGAVAASRLQHRGRDGFLEIARSPLLPAALLVVCGLAALTSTTNKGSAFFAPLVPAMAVCAGWGLFSVPENLVRVRSVSRAPHRLRRHGRHDRHGRHGRRDCRSATAADAG